jgi:Tol biopolymer transport system component
MIDVEVDAQDNVDCSQPAEIVASDQWAAINPAWSPDSRHIVFATVYKSPSARASGRVYRGDDIWMVGIDGQDLVRLTTTDAADWDPFWAPEPEGGPGRIYFTSLMGGHSNIWSLRPVIVPRISGKGVLSNKEAKADIEKSIIMENLKAQRETGAEDNAKVGIGTQIGAPGGMD